MGRTNECASRGTIIIYEAKTLPFSMVETRIETNKRGVSIQLSGGKGLKLTLSCSYFEHTNNPPDEQEQFYDYLSRDIPDPSDPMHLYIDMGDKNCVINPHTQRYPPTNKEPNKHLLSFITKHNLIEPIIVDHENTYTYIYTRTDKQGHSKAKLDHILINGAAHNVKAESGWTEKNPFIASDHGLIWISLNKDKLDLIKHKQRNTNTENKNELRNIRLKGAESFTHEKFPGIPIRLKLAHDTGKLLPTQIAELISINGYEPIPHLQRQSKRDVRLQRELKNNDDELGTKLASELQCKDAIKWRNRPKRVLDPHYKRGSR